MTGLQKGKDRQTLRDSWVCPVHSRILSTIPDFYSQDANNMPLPHFDPQNVSDIARYTQETNICQIHPGSLG